MAITSPPPTAGLDRRRIELDLDAEDEEFAAIEGRVAARFGLICVRAAREPESVWCGSARGALLIRERRQQAANGSVQSYSLTGKFRIQ